MRGAFRQGTGCRFLQKPSGFPALEIGRQRNLLRRPALGVVPVAVGEAVAAGVRAGAAERDDGDPRVAAVGEPPPRLGPDARDVVRLEGVELATLELERERALEHDVDLLLPFVAVDAAALAGLE